MNKRGILVVISGFSGVGKGTVVRGIMERYDNYALSVSATTRQPREGEIEGVHYFFKTAEEFEEMIRQNELIEYATYVEHYYGTPRKYVEQQLDDGKDVILEIELQGALKIREKFPNAVLLFITAPCAEELKKRLIGRGTEEEDVIRKRLERAFEESEYMSEYEYLVVNDKVELCIERINQIVQSERAKTLRNTEETQKMREQLKQFSKGE